MSVFAVSCAIENAPPAHNTAISFRRVGSPRAAKTRASASQRSFPFALPLSGDMARDVLELHGPTGGVSAERDETAVRRDVVETGLDHRQHRAVPGSLLQREGHEGRLLLRVVDARLDGVRV